LYASISKSINHNPKFSIEIRKAKVDVKDIEESPASRTLLIKMEIVLFFFAFSRCNKLSTAGDRSLPPSTNRLLLFTAGNTLYLLILLRFTQER